MLHLSFIKNSPSQGDVTSLKSLNIYISVPLIQFNIKFKKTSKISEMPTSISSLLWYPHLRGFSTHSGRNGHKLSKNGTKYFFFTSPGIFRPEKNMFDVVDWLWKLYANQIVH